MTGIKYNQSDELIQERLVALTRDLILIPSIPSRPEDLRRCFELVKNHLEALENIEVKEFESEGNPSLIAAPPKCKKPKILMCGHLDVITHPDLNSYRSVIKDGRIYGPGAGDMKGALAILLEAFRLVHTLVPGASLGIAVTADEEVGGEAGIGYLFKKIGLRCQEAMIPDGGSLNEITIEEKGILHLKISCEGQSAHSARPWLGKNPIDRLMVGLNSVRQYFQSLQAEDQYWYPTCSISIISTENQTINRVPSDAHAILDIRFPAPVTVKKIYKKVREILGEDIKAEIIIDAEPTILSPDPLYQKITEEVTGRPATQIRDHGGSDGRFIAAHGIPVMMSRPIVGELHSEGEWIDIASMVQFYHIYERFLLEKLK